MVLPLMLITDDPLEAKYLYFKSQSAQLRSFLFNDSAIDDEQVSETEFEIERQSTTAVSSVLAVEDGQRKTLAGGHQGQRPALYCHGSNPTEDRRVRMTAGGQLILRRQIVNKRLRRYKHHANEN